MAVGTKAEQGNVEERTGRFENRPAIRRLQSPFVAPGSVLRASVDWDWVNVLRRHRHLREHRLADHAIVAVGMVVGNEAFISPVPEDALPGETVAELIGREKSVERLRSRAAAK